MRRIILLLVLAILAPGGAVAAEAPVSSDLINRLVSCRSVTDPDARFACLEAAAKAIDDALARKEIVVIDRETARSTRRSLFGFNLPKIPLFEHEEDEQEYSAKVGSVRSLGHGKWRIGLDNGAVWETTEASSTLEPRAGDIVTIRRAAIGSYFIKFTGERGVRGKRVS